MNKNKSTFIVKTSKNHQTFETGARRDSQDNKSRFDLIPPLALKRVADLYTKGAKVYGEWNWAKKMPYSRFYSSILRHLHQFSVGEKTEDHLAAVVWGCLAIMHFQELGLDEVLDDMQPWKNIEK